MFRNREIRQFGFVMFIIALVSGVLGFAMSPKAGWMALGVSVVCGVSFFVFTKARYSRLANMADEIDQILHHKDAIFMGDSNEGELSILENEITKMTVRIREQNDALKREKDHLSEVLADISHQLRTPLTSATLVLTLLEKENNPEAKRKMLRETEVLFSQMEWLLNALLKLSRLDSDVVDFRKEPVNLAALVKAATRSFLEALDLYAIDLKVSVSKDVSIQADFNWLSEAVQNIIKNCMGSIGEKGTIEIAVNDNPLFTEIVIQDDGPGFKTEDLSHMFERFYRGGQSSAGGYGIGMALTKKIITAQGGTIAVKNRAQGGAHFSIRFSK